MCVQITAVPTEPSQAWLCGYEERGKDLGVASESDTNAFNLLFQEQL